MPAGGWTPVPDPTLLTTEAVTRATEVFRREIGALREIHEKDITAIQAHWNARMDGIEQQRELLWANIHNWPAVLEARLLERRREFENELVSATAVINQRLADLDRARDLTSSEHKDVRKFFLDLMVAERQYIMAQIEIISTRMSEKFTAIDQQFSASKTAVDAALSAAKEAVAEQNKANSAAIKVSEGNTKEQLTSLGQVSSANFRAMEDKISDARDRLTSIESITRGIEQAGGKGTESSRYEAVRRHEMTSMVISVLAVLASVAAVIVLITRK